MFCIINKYRPPDTPLMNYYTTGKYEKDVNFTQFKSSAAMPVIQYLLMNIPGPFSNNKRSK